MKSQKGSAFEREICGKLSLWWTGGENDAVFWRTSGSGARACVRSKKGRATSGQHGDIAAIDPCGRPLIDKILFELKRGYNKVTMVDLLDSPATPFQNWIDKAQTSADISGADYWAIIHKRDRREPLIYLPWTLARILPDVYPSVTWDTTHGSIIGIRLGDFLKQISPKKLMDALND